MDVRVKIDPETNTLKAIMMWHPVDGGWIHIAQQLEEGETKYYVNGKVVTDVPKYSQEMLDLIAIKAKDSIESEETVTNEDGA